MAIKTKIVFFLVLSFFVNSIQAQKFTLGVQVGINQTELKAKDIYHLELAITEVKSKITYGFNAYLGLQLNRHWELSIEPGYMYKASDAKSLILINGDFNSKLHFIHLPININFGIKEKLFFSTGPELAYLARVENTTANDFQNIFTKNFELSYQIGAYYRFNRQYDFGVKYSYGLTTLTPEKIIITSFGAGVISSERESRVHSRYLQVFLDTGFQGKSCNQSDNQNQNADNPFDFDCHFEFSSLAAESATFSFATSLFEVVVFNFTTALSLLFEIEFSKPMSEIDSKRTNDDFSL